MKQITVDQKKCLGCGTCVMIASKTFIIGKEGKAEVVNQAGDSEEKIQEAVNSCPVQAILIIL